MLNLTKWPHDDLATFRPVAWMVGASLASSAAAIAWTGRAVALEILLGMAGPLLAVGTTWIATARAYRQNPARVTAHMVAAFGGKVVFFGVYVTVMLTLVTLQPIPFAASFTTYFIALYLFEAVWLQRLFARPHS